MKKFLYFFLCLCFICVLSISCFAVDYNTYSDVTASTTQVTNLLSLRSDSDVLKKYVCIRTQDDYILFISDDFEVVGDNITTPEATLIVYKNSGVTGNATRYYSITQKNIKIVRSHVVVSNFIDNSSKVNNTDWNKRITIILVCILAVLLFWVVRRFK